MRQLNEDIKTGQLKQVYLLFGEEAYLRKQYRDRLRNALAGEDTMNSHYFEGKDVHPGELIDLAETLPFLAERRVLIVENSGLLKKGGEQLADYIRELPDTAYFVFVETEVDKRSRLYKVVKEKGRITEFAVQEEGTLLKWIAGLASKEKKQMPPEVIRYFLEKTGTDMANIRIELEKLFCYTLEKEQISREDIDAVCARRVSNRIFEMVEAVAGKKQKKALDLYYDLLSLKEPPMRILFLLVRQFNLLMQVKECRKKGYDNRVIAEKVGLHSFVAGKYVQQASKFDIGFLRAALRAGVEAEERVKTGKMNDIMSVELLIIEYSMDRAQGIDFSD